MSTRGVRYEARAPASPVTHLLRSTDPRPSLATPTRLSCPLAVALLTTLSALALMLAPCAGLTADAPQPTASAEAPLPAATEA